MPQTNVVYSKESAYNRTVECNVNECKINCSFSEMSQSCCLKYSEIKAKFTPSNSQIFATAVNKLPPGETPNKYPHNDTLNE